MKKHLFVVHSYYMLLVSIQIKLNFLKDAQADIILSDASRDSQSLFERLKKETIFSNCYYMHDNVIYSNHDNIIKKFLKLVRSVFIPKYVLKKSGIEQMDFCYDSMYCYLDIRISEQTIFNAIKSVNPNAICYTYEEGMISYFSQDGVLTSIESNSAKKIMPFLLKIFNKKDWILRKNVKGSYFFSPELLQYDSPVPIYRIPRFKTDSPKINKMINNIFNYDAGEIDAEFIYLEDFSYADGNPTDDIEIIKYIKGYCDLAGNQMIVKLHPRSPDNRFTNLGIRAMTHNVPIEVIMMNTKTRKTLITISSGGPIACLNNFKSDINVIMLCKCTKYKPKALDNKEFTDYIHSTKKLYANDRLFMPENLTQLQHFLKRLDGAKEDPAIITM